MDQIIDSNIATLATSNQRVARSNLPRVEWISRQTSSTVNGSSTLARPPRVGQPIGRGAKASDAPAEGLRPGAECWPASQLRRRDVQPDSVSQPPQGRRPAQKCIELHIAVESCCRKNTLLLATYSYGAASRYAPISVLSSGGLLLEGGRNRGTHQTLQRNIRTTSFPVHLLLLPRRRGRQANPILDDP